MAAPIPPSNLSFSQLLHKAGTEGLTAQEEEVYEQKAHRFIEEIKENEARKLQEAQEDYDSLSEARKIEYNIGQTILLKRMSDIPLTEEELAWQTKCRREMQQERLKEQHFKKTF